MKVLFLGYAISREEDSKIYGASVAGNKMQINLLEQLSHYQDIDLKSITIYPTAAYPRGKVLVRRQSIHLFDAFYSRKVGFINLPIIKQIFETLATYFEANRLVKKEGIKTIFTYNMYPQVGLPAKWLKKKYGCEIVTLLADLPIDEAVGRKGFSVILRKYFDYLTCNAILYCDKIITLNKYAVKLYAPNSSYIVMEGGVELSNQKDMPVKEYKEKNIVYSGALVEYNGIINLIKAMKYVKDQEVILHIYGRGQLENYVNYCTTKMPNVKYHGKVDNTRMMQIQREAYLLVNPRTVDDPIAMVTFPSKILEYMMSGTPVLTTKLNGFTEDYFDKMFFVEQNEPIILANKINEIMCVPIDELDKKALLAKQFVLENKNWKKQCEKIYEFIKEGYHE